MNVIAAAQINTGGLWETIRGFFTDFHQMFPGFEEKINEARTPFYLFGFVLLVYSLIQQLSGPGTSTMGNMRAIAKSASLVAIMAVCIQITNLVQVGFLDLSKQMSPDTDPVAIEGQMENVLVTLTKEQAQKQSNAGSSAPASTSYWSQAKGYISGAVGVATNPGAAIAAGLDATLASLNALLIHAVTYVIILFYKLVEMFVWIVLLLQKLLLLFNSIFLPVMIAMLGIGALSSMGSRYILGMFGVCAWPIGWGVVNAGTVAMITSVVAKLNTATDMNSLMSYLWAVAILMVIPCWVVFGYLFAPLAIQKMVTTGAGAAQGILGAAAASTARLVGAAIGTAALGAVAAGGGPVSGGGGSSSAAGGVSKGSGPAIGGSSNGSSSAEGGGGSGGPPNMVGGLAGTFTKAATNAANSIANGSDSIAQAEGHTGGFSFGGGNAAAQSNSASMEIGDSPVPAQADQSKSSGSKAPNGSVSTGSLSESAKPSGTKSSTGTAIASSLQAKSPMSIEELDALAQTRGQQIATPTSTNPNSLYPGLTESSAAAWQMEEQNSASEQS